MEGLNITVFVSSFPGREVRSCSHRYRPWTETEEDGTVCKTVETRLQSPWGPVGLPRRMAAVRCVWEIEQVKFSGSKVVPVGNLERSFSPGCGQVCHRRGGPGFPFSGCQCAPRIVRLETRANKGRCPLPEQNWEVGWRVESPGHPGGPWGQSQAMDCTHIPVKARVRPIF